MKEPVKKGLQAQTFATQLGDDAAAEIAGDANNPALKTLLQQGSTIDNPTIEAHDKVSKKIRAEADAPETRDLGIIASGQFVMHDDSAGLGTLATYAKQLGETETSTLVGTLLDQASQNDQAMTALAPKILNG